MGEEEISASFGMKLFAVSWTWYRLPFPKSPEFFHSFRGTKGDFWNFCSFWKSFFIRLT
jgi:hypothetical protein